MSQTSWDDIWPTYRRTKINSVSVSPPGVWMVHTTSYDGLAMGFVPLREQMFIIPSVWQRPVSVYLLWSVRQWPTMSVWHRLLERSEDDSSCRPVLFGSAPCGGETSCSGAADICRRLARWGATGGQIKTFPACSRRNPPASDHLNHLHVITFASLSRGRWKRHVEGRRTHGRPVNVVKWPRWKRHVAFLLIFNWTVGSGSSEEAWISNPPPAGHPFKLTAGAEAFIHHEVSPCQITSRVVLIQHIAYTLR